LVENVQDYAIFFMDASGYIQTWNKGAEKTKGYKASEIIGKHFSIFYTPEDILDKKPNQMLEIAKKVGRVEDEDWRVRKDGSKFWANVVITALYDENGELQGFAKVTRNLTERKEHEDELKNANVLLQEQQKELERLNESKDEFISLASHQLRTPATAIKQLLGLLLEGFEGPLPENLHKIIQKTYDSNERQIMIVNSLLRVAQIDAGKIVLRKKPCNINSILDSLTKQYEGIIRDKHQTLTCSLPNTPVVGCVDEHYYRMALENILDNASKYTKDGGKIEVSSETCDSLAHVAIKDTGVGVAAEDIPLLFEKFHRIPNNMSHKIAGSGLGLYWVEKVIGLHQGKIEVESQAGKGTTFHIFVPLGDEHA
jgi:PAS domain S-box-containing protein